MNLKMGSQTFRDVAIPVLWGERAIIQDGQGRLSVVDLSGSTAVAEIVADKPARGINFKPRLDGFVVIKDDSDLYAFDPNEKTLVGISLDLPNLQITPWSIRFGTNEISSSSFIGTPVGIVISKDGMALGAPLPPSLARLRV